MTIAMFAISAPTFSGVWVFVSSIDLGNEEQRGRDDRQILGPPPPAQEAVALDPLEHAVGDRDDPENRVLVGTDRLNLRDQPLDPVAARIEADVLGEIGDRLAPVGVRVGDQDQPDRDQPDRADAPLDRDQREQAIARGARVARIPRRGCRLGHRDQDRPDRRAIAVGRRRSYPANRTGEPAGRTSAQTASETCAFRLPCLRSLLSAPGANPQTDFRATGLAVDAWYLRSVRRRDQPREHFRPAMHESPGGPVVGTKSAQGRPRPPLLRWVPKDRASPPRPTPSSFPVRSRPTD